MSEAEPHDALALMRRVARGDRGAAATLFERHGNTVYRYLRGSGAAAADAEDLTQEVFVRALSNAASYRGRGSLEGWLLRIARASLMDEVRREGSRRRREREWAESRPAPPDPSAGSAGRRLLSDLFHALSPEDREVIVLAKFLELSAPRIAEILEITAGAARVRLHRALGRLAEIHSQVDAP